MCALLSGLVHGELAKGVGHGHCRLIQVLALIVPLELVLPHLSLLVCKVEPSLLTADL